jgi:hypothetical protein
MSYFLWLAARHKHLFLEDSSRLKWLLIRRSLGGASQKGSWRMLQKTETSRRVRCLADCEGLISLRCLPSRHLTGGDGASSGSPDGCDMFVDLFVLGAAQRQTRQQLHVPTSGLEPIELESQDMVSKKFEGIVCAGSVIIHPAGHPCR